MSARQMNAKYAGKCAHCSVAISPGDPIMFETECKAVWHIECHEARMSTAASPIKPVQAGTTARYKKPELSKEAMERAMAKAEREHAEHGREQEKSEMLNCLKRVYFVLDDSQNMRKNLDPRALMTDIRKTITDVIGEGWDQ